MASRYWVGGTATWDSTAGTKWSATSGGAGGASVPTASDDVFLDAASGTVTISVTATAYAKALNCTGFTGTFTITTGQLISVNGSLTLSTTMTINSSGANISIKETAGNTAVITPAGKSFGSCTMYIGSASTGVGTVQLAGAMTCGIINHYGGTFNTNGFTLTGTNYVGVNPVGSLRTLTLGASSWSLSGSFQLTAASDSVVNPGTSHIILTSASATYYSDLSAYNVSMTSTSVGTRNIGSMTAGYTPSFNNLTLAYKTGYYLLNVNANMTVNGTLTLSSSASAINRVRLCSNTVGVQRTITVNTVSMSYWDFLDIALSGPSAPYSGTSIGNCGNNSGITFTAAKTVYRVGTNTTWLGSNSWALTSGGAGSNNNYPLPQDTIILDNVFTAATLGFSSSYSVGTLNCTSRTNALTISLSSNYLDLVGSFTGSSAITITATSSGVRAIGDAAQTFTQGSATYSPARFDVSKTPGGGALTLGANFTFTGITGFILNYGAFDLGGYALSCWRFSSSSSNTRSIAFSGGYILLSATTDQSIWDMTTATGFTYTGTSDVRSVGPASSLQTLTFIGGTPTVPVNFTVTGGTAGAISMSGRVLNLDFYFGGASTFTGSLTANISIYGNLTLNSAMTWNSSANPAAFVGTDATTKTIDTKGRTIAAPVSFDNSSGGGWQLLGALTTSSTVTITNGAIDLNGFNVSATSVTVQNSPTLTFNGATVTVTTTGTAWNCTGTPTITAGTGTGTISLTNSGSKTFAGNSLIYPITVNQGGTGGLTFTGSNTFNDITNTAVGIVRFTAGTTTEFLTGFNLNGTSTAARLTLGSTTTAQATLKKPTTWYMGAGSLDGGNNTNLVFTAGGGIDFLSVSYINGTTGGTTYASDITETATGTESVSAAQTFEVSLSETGTGTDSISAAITTTYAANISESATGTDSVSALGVFISAATESATGTDSVAASFAFNSAISETATGTDSISSAFLFSSSVSESATGTDSVSAGAAYARAITETATGSDAVSSLAVFRSTLTDSATGTDTVAGSLAYSRSIAETATGTDTVAAAATFVVSLSETATGTDSISAALAYSRSISETATGTDSVSAAATFAVSLSDSATGTDAVTPDLQISRSISESATGTDSISGGLAFTVYITETSSGADEVAAALLISRDISESATMADAVSSALDAYSLVSESATLTDATSALVEVLSDVSESASGADELSVTLDLPSSITETAAGADEVAVTLTLPSDIAESASGADQVSVVLDAVGAVAETATGTDAVTTLVDVLAAVSETSTGADAIAVTLTLPASVAETGTVSDLTSSVLNAAVAVVEAASGADAVSVAVGMYPTVSETASIVDSVLASSLYISTVSETASGADAVSALRLLFAAVSETGTGTDALTAVSQLNSAVAETAIVTATVLAGNVMYVTLEETAVIYDLTACNYLWNLIDDSQTAAWGVLETAQAPTWTAISSDTAASWSSTGTTQNAGWGVVDDSQDPGWQNTNNL